MRVSETTANDASVPLKVTELAPVNDSPLSTTRLPASPLDGENELTVGTVGASSSTINPVPTPSVISAPATFVRLTSKVSNASASVSPLISTVTVRCVVEPEKERLPEVL